MTRPHIVLLPVALAALLALGACGSDIVVGSANLHIKGNDVEITPRGHAPAVVRPDGGLLIDGAAVEVPGEARERLVAYSAAVRAMLQHGIETGKAGAAVAASAVSEVTKGLASGDTSQIGAKVEEKADAVRAKALSICDDLAAARREQEAVAAAVAAFRPYAVIEAGEGERCRH